MRKPMAKKVLAASLAAAMTMGVTACGGETPASVASTDNTPASTEDTSVEDVASTDEGGEEEVSPYTVITDADGNAIDLGGMEIVVRDWWSSGERAEAQTDFDEARYEYQDWCEETYNFKLTKTTVGDWGSAAQDFVDYVIAGGDDTNYVFTIPSAFASTILSSISSGLVYDLSTLDCLDFSAAEFSNGVHKLYTIGDGIYAFRVGVPEPRTGLYFNKRILEEAGVNCDDIYDMQANGTWTWDKFEEILEKVQQDVDNDGTIDIWGIAVNESVMTSAAVFSNGGCFVGKDADGNFTYEFESPETLEALEWCRDMYTKYDYNGPDDEEGNPAAWDWYQGQFKNGGAAFLPDQYYCAKKGNLFADMEDELGFVMFPAGPKGKLVQCVDDNVYIIPGCYDAERAWNIAFAYAVYDDMVPGFENTNEFVAGAFGGNFDQRAMEETIPMMVEAEHVVVAYHGQVPNLDLGAPFEWNIGPNCAPISEIIDGCRDMYKQAIDEANQ